MKPAYSFKRTALVWLMGWVCCLVLAACSGWSSESAEMEAAPVGGSPATLAGATPGGASPADMQRLTPRQLYSSLPTWTPAPTRIAEAGSQPSATPGPPGTFRLCSPLAEQAIVSLGEIVSDPYHPPPPGREERHHGVDFAYYNRGGRAAILGEAVQAVFGGKVAAAIQDRFPYGNVVIIETRPGQLPPGLADSLGITAGQSLYTLYAHMLDAPLVALDESIDSCRELGAVGNSGNAGGAHLHLEMRIGPAGVRFPEMAYYHADASGGEREAYLRWRTGGEFNHFDPMLVLK